MRSLRTDQQTTSIPRNRAARGRDEMDHFVRALSHDMTANLMLLESSLREVQANCTAAPHSELSNGLAHVEACLHESKRFLDDLVTLGKTGRVQMEPEHVELTSVVRDVLNEQRPLLEARRVRVGLPSRLPAVWCHPNRAKQVFTNLIRNAVRHGCNPADPLIRIEAICCPARFARTGAQQVWLRVYDNGRGIPAAERQNIFLPGHRLATAAPDGTGMGLAIIHRIVEHLGGRILVDPAERHGTAFVFSLPAAPTNAPTPCSTPPPHGRRHVRSTKE